MDKAQKSLIDTYYRKRAIAAGQSQRYKYQPYEYSKYALENKIMDFSKLSIGDVYKIYSTNPNVKEYIKPILDDYNSKSTGFLKILLGYPNNIEELETFITNSEFYKENGKEIGFNKDYNGDYFLIEVKKNNILNILDLENNYDSVETTASGNYYGNRYDSDELNYMYGGLSASNKAKVNKIAKMIGVDDKTISEFNEEGNFIDFLDKHKLGEIGGIYLSEYNEAYNEAEMTIAKEQLSNFPLDIEHDETTFYIEKILQYIYLYNLNNISTFDQFLDKLASNNDISYDDIYEDAYNHMDLTQLNQAIDDKLVEIIDEFDDPDSEYYELVKGYNELQEYISKYKFTPINKNGIIATRRQSDKTINILDFNYDEEEEDNKKLKFKINFIYSGGKKPFERSGWIFATNLGNYIEQHEMEIMRETI